MINYAHRGASEYAPENTFSSFYLGLLQGANGIETDVQKTSDGVLVLFHDDTVDRVTDGSGKVADFTFDEIKKLKIIGNTTAGFYDRIVTLREFLEKFSSYDISFAIELKEPGCEAETLEMIKEFDILGKTTVTSFNYECIKRVKELDSKVRVGWLTENPSECEIKKLLEIGGEEMAPKAENITEDMIRTLRGSGLGVRAWGVSSIRIMKEMCQKSVDGMTVNFPDRLFQYLK